MSNFHERKLLRTVHYFNYIFGWRLLPCTACSGSGRYDAAGSPRCGACNGHGKVRRPGPKAYKPPV
jgi:hypothetical protein